MGNRRTNTETYSIAKCSVKRWNEHVDTCNEWSENFLWNTCTYEQSENGTRSISVDNANIHNNALIVARRECFDDNARRYLVIGKHLCIKKPRARSNFITDIETIGTRMQNGSLVTVNESEIESLHFFSLEVCPSAIETKTVCLYKSMEDCTILYHRTVEEYNVKKAIM